MNLNCQYQACTPQISYFSDKKKIWNCGGRLFGGFRKYYYADQRDVKFTKSVIDISFVTGCALLIRSSLLDDDKKLFTERFFFGEEDFEFSLRMKEKGCLMACVLNSLIYHKVGSSTQDKNELPKMFIHYLNRYINIRQHFSPFNYHIWKIVNNIWIFLLLYRKKYSVKTRFAFVKKLNIESKLKEGVEYD